MAEEERGQAKAALHRLSAFIIRTERIMKSCRSFIDAYAKQAALGPSVIFDDSGRLRSGQLTKIISDLILENGIDLHGNEKAILQQTAEVELAIRSETARERYEDAICDLLSALSDARAADLFIDSILERHMLDVMHSTLQQQIVELAHLEIEMTDIFAPLKPNSSVDLETEVRLVVDRFKQQQDQKNRAVKFINPSILFPVIFVNREKLRRVMVLLIENGLKYTLDMRSGETSWINVRIKSSRRSIIIEIESWGCPVFREEEEAVFERGFRGFAATRLHIDGRGQGLAEARELARSFGGDINIWSQGHPTRALWHPGDRFKTWAKLAIPTS